tara:strand:- start:111 stop:497 length:387 start_codon:yes stop_codon:yes gene_type:complete
MNDYNVNFECTYHNSENYTDEIYRSELMKAFNITKNNLDSSLDDAMVKVTENIDKLYLLFKSNDKLKEVLSNVKSRVFFLSNLDDDYCFLFLFGYETFYIMHKILKKYEINESLDESIKELVDKIELL